MLIESGKFKDTFSPLRPMTEEERVFLEEYIDDIFHQFVKDVADGRKLPESEMIKIADGRIITGQQALKLKLIDGLGNMEDAIDKAAGAGGNRRQTERHLPGKEEAVAAVDPAFGGAGWSLDVSGRSSFRARIRMIP